MDPTLADTLSAIVQAPAVTDAQALVVVFSMAVAWVCGRLAKLKTSEGSAMRQLLPVAIQYLSAIPAWVVPGILAGERLPQLGMRLVLGVAQGGATGGWWSQGRAVAAAKRATSTPLLGK